MNAWQITKWCLLVVVVLAMALGLARTFSGPEDDWVRDASGKWVEHGHPAGPPPPPGYRPPLAEVVLPWMILAIAVAGLVGGIVISRRAPASRDALSRDIRFFGTISVAAAALLVASTIGLIGLGIAEAAKPMTKLSEADLIMSIAAIGAIIWFAGLLALVALQSHGIRKLLEAHYDLKRSVAILQDSIEQPADGGQQNATPG